MTRAVRWIELGALFGLLPAALATFARSLSLPVLFVAAWLCLAVLWRDPTFQRDQLWRREQHRRNFGSDRREIVPGQRRQRPCARPHPAATAGSSGVRG